MQSAGSAAPRATAERRHSVGASHEDEALSRFDVAGPTTTSDSPRLGTPATLNLRPPARAPRERQLGEEETGRCSTNTTYHHVHKHDESAKAYVCGDG